MALKTDYKDDVFPGSRKYIQTVNEDGTISLSDATQYEQQGDYFGANELNAIGKAINNVASFEAASGVATAITLTGIAMENGNSKTFIVAANNNGAATTINGKPLYKPGGTAAPKLVTGKAVTVWYDSAGECFFIKASAEGDTVAAEVLAGKTFSNDDDTGLVGTMPNNGAVNQSLPINGTYNIPAGYHNGSGKVTQSITSKSAATYTPGTSDQTIAAGQYLSGAQTIKGDANLVPAKILTGNTIFGVAGSGVGVNNCAQITGLAGVFGSSVQGRVALNWTNPTDGLFKGVRIMYKTGAYPTGPTDGSVFYDSSGSDSVANTATVNLTEGTTYYFRAFAYTYLNATRIYTTTTAGAQVTGMPYRPQGIQTFTSSGTFTVPPSVTLIDIFCVGGGGGSKREYLVGGGGGGYTATKKAHAVTPGQQFAVVVGAGGISNSNVSGNDGSTTSFGGTILTAAGGGGSAKSGGNAGGGGGSGGGGAQNTSGIAAGAGGSDGSNGSTSAYAAGAGQGTTTRAFGEAGNTLYAGGGGGGGGLGGTGGSGGGGRGSSYIDNNAVSGTANTGGGGGGSGAQNPSANGGSGGSGVCIVRWGY